MKLINTDGMALIGPGSEWLWTALSGLVLAITFVAIWRQLAMARSASAREQLVSLDRDWDSERMTRYQIAVITALRDGVDPAQLPDGPASGLANWWERIGQLARSGDLDRKLLYPNYGLHAQAWWAILAPYVRQKRAEQGNPHQFEVNEWLSGIMAEMDRRAGRPPADAAMLGPHDILIGRLQGRLSVEEALRTVIVAPPNAAGPWSPMASPGSDPAPA